VTTPQAICVALYAVSFALLFCAAIISLGKFTKFNGLILLCFGISTCCGSEFNLLTNLAWIESRNNDLAVGDKGRALGRYQMTEAAWCDVSALRKRQGLPIYEWQAAHDPGIAREYACQYLGILSRQLRAALRRPPTDAELYCSYNLGFTGFQKRSFSLTTCPPATRRAAERMK